MRPEIAQGWIALHRNPTSTADDIKNYAKSNGFQVDEKDVDRFIRDRSADPKRPISDELSLAKIPRVLTDHKDGVTGAALRGFADPFNVLDEAGAVVDSLAPGDRENVWSSDRRFGDVYANNLDQNRSILAFDDTKHPYARFGGQLVGGLVAPGASIEGVGFGAARSVLEAGGTRFAAEQAAKRAVVTRLGVAGGVEGTVAGVGQGEDWKGRVQGGLVGAPLGVALGLGTGFAAPHIAKLVGRPFSGMAGAEAERSAQDFTDGAIDAARAGTQNSTTPGSVGIADDAARLADDVPPPPPGYRLVDEPAADVTASVPARVAPADPSASELWRTPRADLERMLADKSTSDRDKLVGAFGEDGAKEFQRLDRKRNSSDPRISDEGSREFETQFGDLTPEQERAAYGVGETDAQADDIREVLSAHTDLDMGEGEGGQDWLGYVAALGARRAPADELAAVTRGEGPRALRRRSCGLKAHTSVWPLKASPRTRFLAP
ncbi:hypothetical protein QP162_21915 [Sphingomonas aurantiaca]|uniref:hypothetical protein n=1 Tax=Sphingomonas aurantiaca TaxID=185949 RepID=UPI002FDF5F46